MFWCSFGAARTPLEAVLLVPLLILSGPAVPNTRTFLSCSVSPEMQSRALSAFSAIEALCTLVAPAFSAGYAHTVNMRLPFLMFEVMGCLTLISFSLVLWVSLRSEYPKNIPISNGCVVTKNVVSDFRSSHDSDRAMDTYMLLRPHIEVNHDQECG